METFLKSGKPSFTYKIGIDGHFDRMNEIVSHLQSLINNNLIPMVYMQRHLHQNTDFDASPWRIYEQNDGKHLLVNHIGTNLHIYIPLNASKTLIMRVD